MTASTAQAKLDRIAEQISLATGRLTAIDTEIRLLEKDITQELLKVTLDEDAIAPLEGKRAELKATRETLKARVTALQSTIPANEKAVNEAVLKEAISECGGAVEDVNDLLSTWRKKAKETMAIEQISKDVVNAKSVLAGITSKIAYLSALLGEPKTELPQADHISRDEAFELREAVGRACSMKINAFYSSSYDELLKKLNAERAPAIRAAKREKHRESLTRKAQREKRQEEAATG